ncbi:tryptophan-rich sensory protein [Candidatus Gracilibacteria bacterium]|nr:tryptophan-rich sensory protein [Candidatus Gracilibacteria bacterium]
MRKKVVYATLAVIAVAAIGSLFSSNGMLWYDSEIIKPALTPPDIAFPIAWNLIFILCIISIVLVRENTKRIYTLFAINGVLNILWSLLFFTLHQIPLAFADMLLLELTNILLITLIWRQSRLAAVLLLPYAIWVAFASYLTWQILLLN